MKTHILLIDKRLAAQSDRILYIDIESDGFTQTDTRLPVERNDIPYAMQILDNYRNNPEANPICSEETEVRPEVYFVSKGKILTNPSCALIGRWYNIETKYPKTPPVPFKRLVDLCDFHPGLSPNMKTLPGEYSLVTPAEERKTSDHFDMEGPAVCVPIVSSSGHGKADVKRLHYQEGKFALATTMIAVCPKNVAECPECKSLKIEKTEDKFKCRDCSNEWKVEITTRYLFQVLSEKKDMLIATLMAGATNVTLKQDLFEKVLIPVPSQEIQKEIVDHAAWEALAEGVMTLRTQVAQGIDGEKADEIVDLLDQAKSLLHLYATKKRTIDDLWREN